MSIFNQIQQANDVKETKDSVGGFQPLSSGLYRATIKQMYAKPSASKSLGVSIEFEIQPASGSPRKFTETYYVTDRNNKNYYETKTGEKHYLAGFNHVNDLCLGLTGKTLFELSETGGVELKNVKVYNYTTKKDEIEQLPVFTALLEKQVALGLVLRRENKNTKTPDGTYVPTAEERTFNAVEKMFFIRDGKVFTHNEIKAQVQEPVFVNEWLNRWQDKVDDRYKEATGTTNTSAAVAPTTAMILG